MTRQELRVFLDTVPFCGCGCPQEAADALLRVLRAFPLYEHLAALEEMLPDLGLRFLFLYMLDHTELTEHGSAIDLGWLTEKGKAVRDALDVEEADSFKALFAEHCACGYDTDDLSHRCA
jgi:hypothetical protein